MKALTDYLQYIGVIGIAWIVGHTPRFLSNGLAAFIGFCGAPLPGFGQLVSKNLKAAFPEIPPAERRRMTRKSLESLTRTLFEFFWIHQHPDRFNELYTCTEECESVGRRLSEEKERPRILITPHFGNWEISGMILPLHFGIQMATVVRSPRNPFLDKLISGGRMVPGVKIVHSRRGMLHLLELMKQGYAAGLLIDQNTKVRDGGVFIDFFGLPGPISRSPAVLARKMDALVAVGCSVRGKDGHFTGYLRMLPKETKEYTSDKEMLQDIMRISEELIRLAPEQYLWMYKRFQNIPPDASEELKQRYPDYAAIPPPSFFDIRAKRKAKYKKVEKKNHCF